MPNMKWSKIWDSQIGPKMVHFPNLEHFPKVGHFFQAKKCSTLGSCTVWHPTQDPIVLSDKSIPIIELRTVETEYQGLPYTNCHGPRKHTGVGDGYDVTVCRTIRKVENIIKMLCL